MFHWIICDKNGKALLGEEKSIVAFTSTAKGEFFLKKTKLADNHLVRLYFSELVASARINGVKNMILDPKDSDNYEIKKDVFK